MRTRSDFETAAEHIAYTQGIIDAGRERIPMTEYERASLRLKAIIAGNRFLVGMARSRLKPDRVIDADEITDALLAFALKPDEDA